MHICAAYIIINIAIIIIIFFFSIIYYYFFIYTVLIYNYSKFWTRTIII